MTCDFYKLYSLNLALRSISRVAQWKRAGPITQRSVDRNHALLIAFCLSADNIFGALPSSHRMDTFILYSYGPVKKTVLILPVMHVVIIRGENVSKPDRCLRSKPNFITCIPFIYRTFAVKQNQSPAIIQISYLQWCSQSNVIWLSGETNLCVCVFLTEKTLRGSKTSQMWMVH